MNLHSNQTYWPTKNNSLPQFPSLNSNETCEVVIIGGGITGALIADSFSQANIPITVIDKRKIGHGSTSASTALLQYEIDIPLYKLSQQIGKPKAITAYQLCAQAISYIDQRIQTLDSNCNFAYHPSLYFSNISDDPINLKKEFVARQEAGFDVRYLQSNQIQNQYHFTATSAIQSQLAAQVDPYQLTHALLESAQKKGAKIYANTSITNIDTSSNVTLTCQNGNTIYAKKVIFATGYETQKYLQEKTAKLLSTYACVTQPLPEKYIWSNRSLLWNTNDPYFYARTTSDNRILFGGEDIQSSDDHQRDQKINSQTQALSQTLSQLFPDIPFKIQYSWAGTFGETTDGLPYIGISPEWNNAYFALGYGGNGITFSAIAAQALLALHQGHAPQYLDLFRFGR